MMKRLKFLLALILSLGLALVPFNGTSLAATKHLSTKSTAHASYKLTATLDNKHPKQYGTVHLMVKGLPSGTKYKAVFHYRTKDTTYYGKVGKSLTVRISRATKGFKVKINISATYKGKTYKTETYFIPR
jgi:competence protein ComEC